MFLLKKILNPRPSFFDFLVGGFLFITMFGNDWQRGMFLVFYSAFLVIVSLLIKPKRDYKSLPLVLLTLWSLIGAFIHSFEIYQNSITIRYVNFYMMIEGFIYILFGVLFIHTIIRYSTNLKFIFLLIPFAIIPWFSGLVHTGSTTPMAALGIAIVVYLFLSKRLIWGICALISGIVGVWLNWSWICMKFVCRPLAWYQLIVNIFYRPERCFDGSIIDSGIQLSPILQELLKKRPLLLEIKPWLASIFGGGFENSINNNYMWVDKDTFGWIYMHNDYFHLAQCLGPIVLIFLTWFIINCFKRIGRSIYIIPFLAIVLICFFQLTMFQPGKAGIYLLIGTVALSIRRNE